MADNKPTLEFSFDIADIESGTSQETVETPQMEVETPAAVDTPAEIETLAKETPVQKTRPAEVPAEKVETPAIENTEEPSLISEILTKFGYEDIEADFEESTEGLIQLTNVLSDRKAEETLDNLFESFPTLYQHFEYLRNGGDPRAFMETVQEPDWKATEINDTNAKQVLREYFKARGEEENFIEDMIEAYEDKNVLTDKATQAKAALANVQEKKREQLVQAQKLEAEKRQKETEQVWNTVKSTITSSSEFAGIPITERDKSKFIEFISAPVDRNGSTQRDIAASKLTLEQQLAMDLLLFKGMDLKRIVELKAGTKQASSLRDRLKSNTKASGGQRVASGSNMEDLGDITIDNLI